MLNNCQLKWTSLLCQWTLSSQQWRSTLHQNLSKHIKSSSRTQYSQTHRTYCHSSRSSQYFSLVMSRHSLSTFNQHTNTDDAILKSMSPHHQETTHFRLEEENNSSNVSQEIGSSETLTIQHDLGMEDENKEEEIWNPNSSHPQITVNFILKDGSRKPIRAPIGQSVLQVAHRNNIDVEGACEASLACSTCHVILDEKSFNKLPEASEREDDLLDMAPHLTDTSRLSCQVILIPELDGMEVKLPPSTLNFYVDGHVPKPH